MTKSEYLLEGLHKLLAMAGEDNALANREMKKFFEEVLQDLSDKEALQTVCQALAIEACTAVYLQRKLESLGN